MLRSFLFIFLISWPLSHGLAQTCGNKDLNESKDSPFRSIPIYDQDGTSICHSYGASQFIDYYRLKNGAQASDGLTSPLHIALLSRQDALDSEATSGDSNYLVYNGVRSKEICDGRDITKNITDQTRLSGLSEAQILYYLQANANNSLILENDYLSCNQVSSLNENLKNLTAIQRPSQIISTLTNNCRKIKLDLPDVQQFLPDQALKEVSKSLNNGYPAMASVCTEFLSDLDNEGVVKTPNGYAMKKSACTRHTVLITAESELDGQCMMLIRNSWGTNWRGPEASPRYGETACACITKSGDYQKVCNKKSTDVREFVGCWFSKESLSLNLPGAVTLNSSR